MRNVNKMFIGSASAPFRAKTSHVVATIKQGYRRKRTIAWLGDRRCRISVFLAQNLASSSSESAAANSHSPVVVMSVGNFSSNFLFRQLFDRTSCTYTYLLADAATKEAVLVDPVIDLADRDIQQVKDLGLSLKYCINTHMHADHITGTGRLKRLSPSTQSAISRASGAAADVLLDDGSEVTFGGHRLEVRSTPGHTSGCVTYVWHDQACAFTGDALLVRGCGRTDFQEGDAGTLFDSVWSKILSLPEHYRLFPAHDYKGRSVTTVDEEKRLNPRLTKTREEFHSIMANLNLSYPAQIDAALPANKVCGLYNLPEEKKHLLTED